MNIEHLRLFVIVARSGSLTDGARQSGMSQSAASQAIAQIEAGLKVALFDRSRRPLALTAAGIRFKAGIEPLLDGWDRTVAGIRPADQALSGSVTVAAIHSLGLHLLVTLTQRFAARHPGVRLRTQHLHHDLVLEAVRQRRADLGIISFAPHLRQIETIHLRDEPLVAVCHPSHRLVPRRRLVLADLDGQRMAAFDPSLPIRDAIDAALRKAGVRVEVVMELDNIESLKQAVLNNCGLAILPEPMVLRETLGRLLVALPIEDVRLVRPIAAIRHRGHHDPATDALIAFLRESMEQTQHAAPVAPVRYGQTPTQWE